MPTRAERRKQLQEAYRLAHQANGLDRVEPTVEVPQEEKPVSGAEESAIAPIDTLPHSQSSIWELVKSPIRKAEFIASLILGVTGIIPMSVVWRCILLGVAWLLVCHSIILPLVGRRGSLKLVVTNAILVAALWMPIRNFWKIEKAQALSGDLVGPSGNKNAPIAIRIGKDAWPITVDPHLKTISTIYGEFPIRIERSDNGRVMLTTRIVDREGHVVVDIQRNHWQVRDILDKNYTTSSLETKDTGGRVVLHVTLLSNEIILEGEWRDEQGDSERMLEDPVTHLTEFIRDPPQQRTVEPVIRPWFKYPSVEHWGENADPLDDVDTSQLVGEPVPFAESPYPYNSSFGNAKDDVLVTLLPKEPINSGFIVLEYSHWASLQSDYHGIQDGKEDWVLRRPSIADYLAKCGSRCSCIRIDGRIPITAVSSNHFVLASSEPIHIVKLLHYKG